MVHALPPVGPGAGSAASDTVAVMRWLLKPPRVAHEVAADRPPPEPQPPEERVLPPPLPARPTLTSDSVWCASEPETPRPGSACLSMHSGCTPQHALSNQSGVLRTPRFTTMSALVDV